MSKSEGETAVAVAIVVLGATVGFGVLLLVGGIISAWALSLLWAWFAVPIFGLPSLTVAQCYAVVLVMAFLTKQPHWDEDTKPVVKMCWPFVVPFLYVGFGWVAAALIRAGY